jgi:hypothetical protein
MKNESAFVEMAWKNRNFESANEKNWISINNGEFIRESRTSFMIQRGSRKAIFVLNSTKKPYS